MNLLLVNQQIRDEAMGVFYGCNHFMFIYPLHLQNFLFSLRSQRKEWIREITVWYKNHNEGGIDSMASTFFSLGTLKSLKRLHVVFVEFRDHKGGIREDEVEEIHKLAGISALKKIRGLEELTIRCLWAETPSYYPAAVTASREQLVGDFTESLKEEMGIGGDPE